MFEGLTAEQIVAAMLDTEAEADAVQQGQIRSWLGGQQDAGSTLLAWLPGEPAEMRIKRAQLVSYLDSNFGSEAIAHAISILDRRLAVADIQPATLRQVQRVLDDWPIDSLEVKHHLRVLRARVAKMMEKS